MNKIQEKLVRELLESTKDYLKESKSYYNTDVKKIILKETAYEILRLLKEEQDPRKTQLEPGDDTNIEISPEATKIYSFMMKKGYSSQIYSDLIGLLQKHLREPKTNPGVEDFFKV